MFNYNAPWHPLKKICLGRSYDPNYYEDISNKKIRDILQRIAYETEEDYLGIEKILNELNVEVIRPHLKQDSILNHLDVNGKLTFKGTKSFTLIPRPPMQPRDSILIIGDEAIGTNAEFTLFSDGVPVSETASFSFDAPCVTVIGQHLIVDRRDFPGIDKFLKQRFPNRHIIPVDIGGHNDAVFAPVKPGVIVSTYYHTNYTKTFPGWEVLYIENQSWNAVPEWRQLKHSNAGKWWMPGEEKNTDFTNFVETWLSNWVGYVEETVFDVNMLMIDDRTALVNNYNKQVFDFFKKHDITPVIAPFRHRFFWDGGIHCITNDLYRQGNVEIYINLD
jgi:hypothetical protein